MALLTVQVVQPTGVGPTYQAAAGGGDTVPPGDDVFLHVKNGSGGALTVAVDNVTPCNYGFDHDLSVSVPAAGERMIGPLSPQRYAQPSSGLANITYPGGVTSLTIAAIRT